MSWWVRAAVRSKGSPYPYRLRMFEFMTEEKPTDDEATAMITSRGFDISPLITLNITPAEAYPPRAEETPHKVGPYPEGNGR